MNQTDRSCLQEAFKNALLYQKADKLSRLRQEMERELSPDEMNEFLVSAEEWKNQFGVPAEQHENTVQVSLFNKYTVFGIQKKDNQPAAESEGSNDEQ